MVIVSPVVATLLEDWRSECEAVAAAVGVRIVPDAFIVSSMPDGSVPINPDSLSSVVTKLCAARPRKIPGASACPTSICTRSGTSPQPS